MAWRDQIVKRLSSWNIRGNRLAAINNFLSHNSLQVTVNGATSKEYVLQNGTRQGSISSPILYFIATNHLFNKRYKPIKARLCADNMVIFVKGKTFNTQKMCYTNSWLNSTRGRRILVYVFLSKKHGLIFRRKHKTSYIRETNPVESVKILGSLFDSWLNCRNIWCTHVTKS